MCVDVEVKMGKGNRFKEVQLEFDFVKKLRRKFFQRKTKGKDGKA